MKETLEALACWSKYKSYTATSNIPKVLRNTEAVITTSEVDETTGEVVEVETEVKMTAEAAF